MLVRGIAGGTGSGKITFAKKIFTPHKGNNLMAINILTNFTQQNLK